MNILDSSDIGMLEALEINEYSEKCNKYFTNRKKTQIKQSSLNLDILPGKRGFHNDG